MKPKDINLTRDELSTVLNDLMSLSTINNKFVRADMYFGEETDRDGDRVSIIKIGDLYDLSSKLEDLLEKIEKITDCDHSEMTHEHTNWYKCTTCGYVEAR